MFILGDEVLYPTKNIENCEEFVHFVMVKHGVESCGELEEFFRILIYYFKDIMYVEKNIFK